MRAVVQRVSEASVSVEGELIGKIGPGLLIFLGIGRSDNEAHADYLAQKVYRLRIFPDEEGKMNRSLLDVSGEMLIVSQFTLYGDTSRGNRPSYSEAAKPEAAKGLYEYFVKVCQHTGLRVVTGRFQAHMAVRLSNDGPVTLMCHAD
jgi:D-aminoacyl-tRNA deacylase